MIFIKKMDPQCKAEQGQNTEWNSNTAVFIQLLFCFWEMVWYYNLILYVLIIKEMFYIL